MKNILIILVLISNLTFAAGVFTENEIFVKDGKTYFLLDEKEVTGIVTISGEGTTSYITYDKGVKVKEKILNSKREVIAEYSLDSNGLINGKNNFTNENGETIKADFKKGLVNGKARQEYYGEFDFEGQFINGVAHGKVTSIDENGANVDYMISTGVSQKNLEAFGFSSFFEKEFVNSTVIKLENGIAKKDGKIFTGLSFISENGYITNASYYNEGILKAEFYFSEGFMYSAKFYKNTDSYNFYTFYGEMNKGILSSIMSYSNEVLNGDYKTYTLNGDRVEGTYVNDEIKGKVTTYNADNKIVAVKIQENKTFKNTEYFDFEKGKIRSVSQGKFDDKIGDWINTGKALFYLEDGSLENEITYSAGNKAYSKEFYPSGKLKISGEVDPYTSYYKGEIKEFYETGVLKAKLNYVDGYLNGKQYYYDSKGTQNKVETYDSGNLIK